jgi:hypothetical protein
MVVGVPPRWASPDNEPNSSLRWSITPNNMPLLLLEVDGYMLKNGGPIMWHMVATQNTTNSLRSCRRPWLNGTHLRNTTCTLSGVFLNHTHKCYETCEMDDGGSHDATYCLFGWLSHTTQSVSCGSLVCIRMFPHHHQDDLLLMFIRKFTHSNRNNELHLYYSISLFNETYWIVDKIIKAWVVSTGVSVIKHGLRNGMMKQSPMEYAKIGNYIF